MLEQLMRTMAQILAQVAGIREIVRKELEREEEGLLPEEREELHKAINSFLKALEE